MSVGQQTKLVYGLTQEAVDALNGAGFMIVPVPEAARYSPPATCARMECRMRGSCAYACPNAPTTK